jgi:hypothetical protein
MRDEELNAVFNYDRFLNDLNRSLDLLKKDLNDNVTLRLTPSKN